ncbi:MAG: glutamate racemase [Acinetobacter sp.]
MPATQLSSTIPLAQKANAQAPIGIFDSGIGGFSVAQEIAKHLPNEKFIYFADTAHVPYGPRSGDDIRKLTAQAIEWLYQQGCKAVVVACNTASAFSLDYLREYYGEAFPIIGLVPALKPAVLNSHSKVVAVLATPATFRGQLIKDVIHHFAEPAGVRVLPITCLELVPLIEAGEQMSSACLTLLKQVLDPAAQQGADYLVLGCTHYPFLKAPIEHLFGTQFSLIDSGKAVARQTSRILMKYERLNDQHSSQDAVRIACFASGGNADQLRIILQRMMPEQANWEIHNISI